MSIEDSEYRRFELNIRLFLSGADLGPTSAPELLGLGLGSSSLYCMYWLRYASTLDPTSALVVAAKPRPLPPPVWRGGPAGGASGGP